MGLLKIITGEEPDILQQIYFLLKNGFDNGKYGEYLTAYATNTIYKNIYGKTLQNLYIPYKNGTSEIDILMITKMGFIVIENKNYSGWIFGNENQYKWTQCLPNGQKNKFYNPIKQNMTHINALRQYLEIDKNNIKSYIVFSERCELKKIPQNNDKYIIVKRNDLIKTLKNDLKNQPIIYNENQINEFTEKLKKLTKVSSKIKNEHIQSIKNKY